MATKTIRPYQFTFKRADFDKKWRWHLKAPNGKVVASSGQSFASKQSAERSAQSIIDTGLDIGSQ